MADETPPKPGSIFKNPQIVAAVIGLIGTIIVAVISIIPAVLNNKPEATIVIVAATNPPATATVLSETPTASPPSAVTAAEPTGTAAASSESNVLFIFDEDSFTALNQDSRALSLDGVIFRSAQGQWEARNWGPSVANALPAGWCLRLRDASVGQRQPPAPCVNKIHGLQEVGHSALFWVDTDSFEVVRNDQVITTCQVNTGICPIFVPQE